MTRTRDKSLATAVDMLQRNLAGAGEDPFAGVIDERAFLYAVGGATHEPWGFNGTLGSSARIHVHRDGYSSAHVGPCAVEPAADPCENLIRQAGLDRDQAELLRDVFARPGDAGNVRAQRLGLTLRTYQRRERAVRDRLFDLRLNLDQLQEE